MRSPICFVGFGYGAAQTWLLLALTWVVLSPVAEAQEFRTAMPIIPYVYADGGYVLSSGLPAGSTQLLIYEAPDSARAIPDVAFLLNRPPNYRDSLVASGDYSASSQAYRSEQRYFVVAAVQTDSVTSQYLWSVNDDGIPAFDTLGNESSSDITEINTIAVAVVPAALTGLVARTFSPAPPLVAATPAASSPVSAERLSWEKALLYGLGGLAVLWLVLTLLAAEQRYRQTG